MADLSSMGSKTFLKVQEIQEPIKTEIQDVYVQPARGEFNAQVIMVTERYKVPLNAINVDILKDAWGSESDLWIGKTVEIYEGEYTNRKGELAPVLKVKAVSMSPDKIAEKLGVELDEPPVFDPTGGE